MFESLYLDRENGIGNGEEGIIGRTAYLFNFGCTGPRSRSLCCSERGLLFAAVRWLLTAVASVAEHGLSSLVACGIFPVQGLNTCPLHWQMDS